MFYPTEPKKKFMKTHFQKNFLVMQRANNLINLTISPSHQLVVILYKFTNYKDSIIYFIRSIFEHCEMIGILDSTVFPV